MLKKETFMNELNTQIITMLIRVFSANIYNGWTLYVSINISKQHSNYNVIINWWIKDHLKSLHVLLDKKSTFKIVYTFSAFPGLIETEKS